MTVKKKNHNVAKKRAKNNLTNAVNFEFFQIYATRSGQKYPQTLKFNPAHQGLSIEVHNITVAQVEAEFQKCP